MRINSHRHGKKISWAWENKPILIPPFLKEEVNRHIKLNDECAKDKTLLGKLCHKI
jgi:hypothetical protein